MSIPLNQQWSKHLHLELIVTFPGIILTGM
jgi:hypothetical protein